MKLTEIAHYAFKRNKASEEIKTILSEIETLITVSERKGAGRPATVIKLKENSE